MKLISTHNLGNIVVCDFCNKDYTNSDEQGGFLFGSKATCPDCAPRMEKIASNYSEVHYITKRAKAGQSFKDFVIKDLRKGRPGVTKIYSW